MKSKLFKKTSLLLLVALLTSQLASCAKQEPIEANEDDKMKGELSVYYVDYADQITDPDYTYETTSLLQNLQNEYPDLLIEPTTFGSREAFMTQVSTELNSGKGPDLFLLDYATMMNWNKMAKNGVYENLTPFLEKDASFQHEDYFEPVMKAGQIKGEQYVLPLEFNFISLFTSKEKIAANGVKFETGYNYKDVLSALTASVDKANKNDEVIPLALSLDRNDFLTCFMQAFGMPFADYEKSRVNLDKESLLEVCNFIKDFYPYSAEAFSNKADNVFLTQNVEKVDYTIDNYSYVQESIQHKTIRKQINEEFVSLMMPKYDNPTEFTACVYRYAAVNSNSKNKQLAYDCAKSLIDIASYKDIVRFPINKNKFDEWMQYCETTEWTVSIDDNTIPFEDDIEVEKITKMVADIGYVTIDSFDVMKIVNDGMQPYIEGDTKTFDECYDETVNKLNLYINE